MKTNFILILLFFIGCSATAISDYNEEILYKEKCGGCHRLYAKEEFSIEEWKFKLPEMIKNANLNEDETKLINHYIFK